MKNKKNRNFNSNFHYDRKRIDRMWTKSHGREST